MIFCCAIRTRRVCVIFSRPNRSLTCLEQSSLRHLMALSRLGVPARHRYLTPSLSAAMLTTCDVSPTGKQVQLFPLVIHALRVSRDQGWVASGSFDRTIKLWDLSRASQAATAPLLLTFTPPESSRAKSSICGILVRAIELACSSVTSTIFARSSYRKCTFYSLLLIHILISCGNSSLPPLLMVCRLPT